MIETRPPADSLASACRRRASRLASLIAALAFIGTTDEARAQATNGANFSALAESAVDYAERPHRPRVDCAGLTRLEDTVTSAAVVPATGDFPGSCKVYGLIPQSIHYVVNLPAEWNGRLYMHGNGGWGGQSVLGDYGRALRGQALGLGFATAFTDTGHVAADGHDARWAHDDREREIDWAFRAVHLTAVAAKRLMRAYYAREVDHSYFDGCSGGGRQGLIAAQRFPEDFDGIAAGAPFLDLPGLQLQARVNQRAIERTPLTPEKVALLGRVIMERFDRQDGVADHVIGNPLAVDFDPARDLPRSAGADGFTDAEIAALAEIYRGPRVGGVQVAPGVVVGAEMAGRRDAGRLSDPASELSAWASRLYPDASGYNQQLDILVPWLRYLAFEADDPDLDWRALDPERDWPRMQAMSAIVDARSPALGAFARRGAKLLLYHGWADVAVSPLMTVDYAERVRAHMGARTLDFFRVFMVPGMFHCRGGRNVDHFDVMTPLIEWVEAGTAPERIVAARVEDGRVTRTRPLCPHPQVAAYTGSGSTDLADNFVCALPKEN